MKNPSHTLMFLWLPVIVTCASWRFNKSINEQLTITCGSDPIVGVVTWKYNDTEIDSAFLTKFSSVMIYENETSIMVEPCNSSVHGNYCCFANHSLPALRCYSITGRYVATYVECFL